MKGSKNNFQTNKTKDLESVALVDIENMKTNLNVPLGPENATNVERKAT